MTHFPVFVLVDGADAIDAALMRERVAELLAPYDENNEFFREGSRWDWWVVGGRWTGMLDGYDPYSDPVNKEPCRFCENGITTQRIADEYPAYQPHVGQTCFQCEGTGQVVSWTLAPHAGDIQPIANVTLDPERLPTAIVTPDGRWHETARMGWWGMTIGDEKAPDDWQAEAQGLLDANPGTYVVLVDCHV